MNVPDIPPTITIIFTTFWLVFFLLGREQLKRVKTNTQRMVLENIEPALAKNKNLTVSQYYKQVNKQWEEMVPKTAKFILHKSELYPVPAKLETVRARANFSPEWVGAFLHLKGYTLKATPAQQERINYIASYGKHITS